MLPLEIRKYLYDIRAAGDRFAEFAAGKTYADYAADALLRSAIERQFEIIGEALNQMLRRDPSLQTAISDSRRIVAFRNRLIHGSATFSDALVWGVLEVNLPTLRREVEALLAGQAPTRDA